MRKTVLGTIVCVAVAFPAAALAQAQATRSADDYVCQLSGVCGEGPDEAELGTKEAPATKGFSLSRRSPGGAGATKTAPETKGFSIKRETAAKPQAPAATRGPAPTRVAKAVKPARAAAPARKMAAARSTGRGDLNLSFELGSAVLTAEARANAKEFAKALMSPALAGKRVMIEGHTDRQGNREYNLDLSQRRAQAVADLLKAEGVPADRLQVKGFGFDKPLPGRSAASSENRRVEAVLLS